MWIDRPLEAQLAESVQHLGPDAERRNWEHAALCSYYPGDWLLYPTIEEHRICGRCPVSQQCQTYAQQIDAVGLWAGEYYGTQTRKLWGMKQRTLAEVG